ncbi:hypothetical protein PYCCODRAFT_1478011 [Trametes coccinea BRFM310]|uniref:F-box domain-containing protein n=1 Tax=Trametes coccinea (strain BRFM310) TaxID=1353009 RepID=A0A1Y2ILY8_TRAC3|nr:hypothetical protein PYCCODRAFT_1478011 [Trametes coccinea BRFM310]
MDSRELFNSHLMHFHNQDLPPIHGLPAELLITILYYARRNLQDIRLSHVCRRWRELVLGMPEFWAAMLECAYDRLWDRWERKQHVSDHYELVDRCLALSDPWMVHATLLVFYERERATIARHADRLDRITVKFFDAASMHAFANALQEGMPNLSTLNYHPSYHPPRAAFPLDPWLSINEQCLPNLRRLSVHSRFGLPPSASFRASLLELALIGYVAPGPLADIDCFIDTLNACTSLVSLELKEAVPEAWMVNHILGEPWAAGHRVVELPQLRALTVDDTEVVAAFGALRGFVLAPTTRIEVKLGRGPGNYEDLFSADTLLRRHTFPSLQHVYLGTTRRKGRIRALGYTKDGTERFDLAGWDYDDDILYRHLVPFVDSPVTTLAINLPSLPMGLSKVLWDRYEYCPPPRQLLRLELLQRTPLAIKTRFLRWLFRSAAVGCKHPVGDMTLCWTVDVERGLEKRSHEDLLGLETVLAEFPEQTLGRLELYGITLKGLNITHALRVPTNPERCTEVAEPHMPRLSELVSEVIVM